MHSDHPRNFPALSRGHKQTIHTPLCLLVYTTQILVLQSVERLGVDLGMCQPCKQQIKLKRGSIDNLLPTMDTLAFTCVHRTIHSYSNPPSMQSIQLPCISLTFHAMRLRNAWCKGRHSTADGNYICICIRIERPCAINSLPKPFNIPHCICWHKSCLPTPTAGSLLCVPTCCIAQHQPATVSLQTIQITAKCCKYLVQFSDLYPPPPRPRVGARSDPPHTFVGFLCRLDAAVRQQPVGHFV